MATGSDASTSGILADFLYFCTFRFIPEDVEVRKGKVSRGWEGYVLWLGAED